MRTFSSVLALTTALFLGVAGPAHAQGLADGPLAPELVEARYLTGDDRFVEVAGARIRLREEGPVDAPAILLLHGFTFSLETWDAWAEALSGDYRVIRYDLLGHGLSGPDPKSRYAPEERAAFIGEVLDTLGLDEVILAGNSLGGLAAWRYAAAAPERVRALVLVSPGAYPINGVTEEPAPVPPMMEAFLTTAPEGAVRLTMGQIVADPSAVSDARVALMSEMIRREGNGAAMLASLAEFTLPDPEAALAAIEAPTLILWGENDRIIPLAHGEEIVSLIPDAALVMYPGLGHVPQEEAPAATADEVARFLDAVLARDGEGTP